MTRFFLRLLAVLLLISAAMVNNRCGKSDDSLGDAKSPGEIQAEKKAREQSLRDKKKKEADAYLITPDAPTKSWIKRASFTPKPVDTEDGKKALQLNVETNFPQDMEYRLSYLYYKNEEKFPEADSESNLLLLDPFIKGDLIHADIDVYVKDKPIERYRTETVMIPNSPPVINNIAIPDINGPGTYSIAVDAFDKDGDTLTYSMTKPASLPQDMQLTMDPSSGVVTCILGKTPPPQKLDFVVIADDGDKGIAKKSVSITFNITKENRKE